MKPLERHLIDLGRMVLADMANRRPNPDAWKAVPIPWTGTATDVLMRLGVDPNDPVANREMCAGLLTALVSTLETTPLHEDLSYLIMCLSARMSHYLHPSRKKIRETW